MKIFILANGDATRWQNYKNVKKQMLLIDGEPLIYRMVRLCQENGVNDITICGDIEVPGAKNIITKSKTKRELFIEISQLAKEPFIMLNGDCYYTEAIIKDCINRDIEKWGHWCRLNANPHTGKIWGEGYIHKVTNLKWWEAKLTELCNLCNEGKIKITNDWTINRFLADWDDIYTHREDLPNEYDILWDDETDDFDFPVDYDNFIAATGKKGM